MVAGSNPARGAKNSSKINDNSRGGKTATLNCFFGGALGVRKLLLIRAAISRNVRFLQRVPSANDSEQFTVGQHLHLNAAALDYLRALTGKEEFGLTGQAPLAQSSEESGR